MLFLVVGIRICLHVPVVPFFYWWGAGSQSALPHMVVLHVIQLALQEGLTSKRLRISNC